MPSRFDKLISCFNAIRKNYATKFCALVITYGLAINIIMAVLLGTKFGLLQILSWGLLAYMIKDELPRVVISCRQPK